MTEIGEEKTKEPVSLGGKESFLRVNEYCVFDSQQPYAHTAFLNDCVFLIVRTRDKAVAFHIMGNHEGVKNYHEPDWLTTSLQELGEENTAALSIRYAGSRFANQQRLSEIREKAASRGIKIDEDKCVVDEEGQVVYAQYNFLDDSFFLTSDLPMDTLNKLLLLFDRDEARRISEGYVLSKNDGVS